MNTDEDPRDHLFLAQLYATGKREAECDDEAFQYCRLVGERGGAKVLYFTGMCYHYGWGTTIDLKAAIECYVRAAELGSFKGLERLYDLHYNQSVKTSLQNAFRSFCEKADQGDVRARFNSGFCYFREIGTPYDNEKARDLFLKAADNGCADAMWMLDCCRYKGFGDGYNGMQGIELMKYAAEMGSAEAYNQLGYAYYNGKTSYGLKIEKDYKQAVEWFQKAADQNHTWATHYLAYCYYSGYGVQRDVREAFQLCKKAALMGNREAQNYVSYFYRYRMLGLSEDEYPVDIDYYEAAYWNRKAVDQDYDDAKKSMPDVLKAIRLTQNQINELMKQTSSFASAKTWYDIAYYYETGDGVKKDEQKAFYMYKLSTKIASTYGLVALARCYEYGIGTHQDILQSMHWNIRAATQCSTEAAYALQKYFQQIENKASSNTESSC